MPPTVEYTDLHGRRMRARLFWDRELGISTLQIRAVDGTKIHTWPDKLMWEEEFARWLADLRLQPGAEVMDVPQP